MNIDFNNVRRHALNDLTSLINELNEHTQDGYIEIAVEHIQEFVDDLRMSIIAIAATHEKGNAGFIDVLGDRKIPFFNGEED
jgi:hypothetical protein